MDLSRPRQILPQSQLRSAPPSALGPEFASLHVSLVHYSLSSRIVADRYTMLLLVTRATGRIATTSRRRCWRYRVGPIASACPQRRGPTPGAMPRRKVCEVRRERHAAPLIL